MGPPVAPLATDRPRPPSSRWIRDLARSADVRAGRRQEQHGRCEAGLRQLQLLADVRVAVRAERHGIGRVAPTPSPLQTTAATSVGSGFGRSGGTRFGMTRPRTLIRTSPLRFTRIVLCRFATHGAPAGPMPNSTGPGGVAGRRAAGDAGSEQILACRRRSRPARRPARPPRHLRRARRSRFASASLTPLDRAVHARYAELGAPVQSFWERRRSAICDSASNTTIDPRSAVTWPGPSYCGATSTTS